ncbi:MAG: TolC family protein [Chitinophagaceae bacterium]|nr:TolC family protein [Chitinophagaceae bacterium]
MPELVNAAENYLPVLKEKQANINTAKASVTQLKHSFMPLLSVNDQINIGTSNSVNGGYLPIGNSINPSISGGIRGDNIYTPSTGNFGTIYAQYDITTFGLRNAQMASANANVSVQDADMKKETYITDAGVVTLYLQYLRNEYQLKADSQNIERYKSIYSVIGSLTLSGLKPGADSSLAKAELAQSYIKYNLTLGKINDIKQQLSYVTGIRSEKLNIDTVAGYNLFHEKVQYLDYQMDSLNNPIIDYFAQQKNYLLMNEKVIRKSYAPRLMVAGSGWMRGSSLESADDKNAALIQGLGLQRYNYMAGIAVTYNLFNGIYKKDMLNVNRYQIEASDYNLQQQKLVLASSVMRADEGLRTIESNLQQLPVQLHSARDTYNQKIAQYKAGIISLIDLANASFVLYRSQTDYIEAISDWYLTLLNKAISTGNLTQFIQIIK